jgi:DNA-binding NarL/FixJ family response regulator
MSITVLIADDHAVVRDGLRSMMEIDSSIKVIGDAGDGREAVDKVAELRPDIAIVDIAMPELNGIDATRRIVQACPTTRVIILSMYSSTEHIVRALRAGALGYVLKESAGIEVVNAIRTVHDGHRYLSEKILDSVIDDYLSRRDMVESDSPMARLSLREREILQLVIEGKSSVEIAEILKLSPKTIETHRSRMMKKLEVRDVVGLTKFGVQHGLIPMETIAFDSENTISRRAP